MGNPEPNLLFEKKKYIKYFLFQIRKNNISYLILKIGAETRWKLF
jgi:hypothetical protein